MTKKTKKAGSKATLGMMLIAIGVVYGDIGTSPMYVMKSIIEGNGGFGSASRELIIGSLSLIIWTITLLTTVKYVGIAMKADNHGEGGIFSLYHLVRKYGKWLVVPAIIGGASILADGVLTPAVTVTTAIEGLRSIPELDKFLGTGHTTIIVITIIIISVLFFIQHAGTSKIGKAFGPVMLIWFSMLGISGVIHICGDLSVLEAFNPIWAVRILVSPYNNLGFMILGSIFLATTGAEALYADMGHVGKANIYASWPFVKICLLLNYLGQGAWLIENLGSSSLAAIEDMNPFFLMLPESFRPFAVLMGAAAAIIASQALITGSYTLVSEAISIDLMPHMQIRYPSETKGQLYIPLVNSVLWILCCLVILIFRTGAHMESAYGLAITVTMLMTTLLLSVYLWKVRGRSVGAIIVLLVFGSIESVFFISSLSKFASGGWFAVLLACILIYIMVVWYRGTQIEKKQRVTLRVRDYIEKLDELRKDESISRCSDNIVFLTNQTDPELIDRDILYSILDKDPKRATTYWFINVKVSGQPYRATYMVENYGTDFVFFVGFNLGFKVDQRINGYLRMVVDDLISSGELPEQKKTHSIYGPSKVGNFKFCFIHKVLPSDSQISAFDSAVVATKYAIRKAVGSVVRWYGLETASLMIEQVPLFIPTKPENAVLRREDSRKPVQEVPDGEERAEKRKPHSFPHGKHR
jgi:KUP system potassium uptake protein